MRSFASNFSIMPSAPECIGISSIRLITSRKRHRIVTLMVQYCTKQQVHNTVVYLDVGSTFWSGVGDNASSMICAARSGQVFSIGSWRTRPDEGLDTPHSTSAGTPPRRLCRETNSLCIHHTSNALISHSKLSDKP